MTDTVKYHISPKTGRPNLCDAKPGNCPLKNDDGSDPQHFSDKPTARAFYEESMKEKEFDTLSKEDEEPKELSYDLSVENVNEAQKRIARANRRLEKAGINDRFEIRVEPYTEIVQKDGVTYQVDRAKVFVDRPTIAYNGFKFLARVEQLDNGEFIASSAPDEELNGWTPTSMNCEHCGKSRDRLKVYVVEDKDGNRKTVGGSCVKLYTGLKPESLWALEWDDVDDLDEDNWRSGGAGSYGRAVVPTANILQISDVVVRKYGYKPTSFDNSTKSMINTVLYTRSNSNNKDIQFANKINALAKKVDPEEVRNNIQAALETSNGDWATNVKKMLGQEYLEDKHIAVLASGMSAVVKREEKKKEGVKWNNEFIGTPNQKISDVKAEVINITVGTSGFGYNPPPQYNVTMRTATGEKIMWSTTSLKHPKVGQKVDISDALVKKHNTWVNDSDLKDIRRSTRIVRAKWNLDPEAKEENDAAEKKAEDAEREEEESNSGRYGW